MDTKLLLDKTVIPKDLYNTVLRDRETISNSDFMNDPKYKILKEGWCAATFGLGYEQYTEEKCYVILNSSEFPDFTLVINGDRYDFENIMVMERDRKIGEEYRKAEYAKKRGEVFIRKVPDEQITANEQELPKRVRDAILCKQKRYGASAQNVNLVIYLNIFAFDISLETVRRYCVDLSQSFESVWLLTGHYIATLLHTGRTRLRIVDGFFELHIPEYR